MDNWFYIRQQESIGPISEIEFSELIRQGIIQTKTLVWNPSMPFDWVEFGSLSPEYFSRPNGLKLSEKYSEETAADKENRGDLLPCDECGRLFARSELINRENFLLCKECSPLFNQQYP